MALEIWFSHVKEEEAKQENEQKYQPTTTTAFLRSNHSSVVELPLTRNHHTDDRFLPKNIAEVEKKIFFLFHIASITCRRYV
jgi:hypothetical protein